MLNEFSKRAVSVRLLLFVALMGAVGCSDRHDEDTVVATKDQTGAAIVDEADEGEKSITLLPVPTIKVTGPIKATESETREIRTLIKKIADLDSPDFGLSATLSGSSFAPIPSFHDLGTMVFTNHGVKTNDAFKKLVEFGPKALPFLLGSLDDKSKTKLKIKNAFGGVTWFGHEIRGNPANNEESAALKGARTTHERNAETPYTVQIGDVCFVAIGQIVNRAYSAVRYQPSGNVVFNSPVQDKKLAAEVRAIWGKSADSQKLLDSLLVDFQSRGDRSEGFQTGAAMRLAYYFQNESSSIIAERLKGLDVTTDWQTAKAANGVDSDDLIRAVAFSMDRRIKDELFDIFKRTTHEGTMAASLPAIGKEHDEEVFGLLLKRLDGPQLVDGKDYAHDTLLQPLGDRFADRAKAAFGRYLNEDNIVRRHNICQTLQKTCGNLSIELLAPFLTDKREVDGKYSEKPDNKGPWLRMRVCDEAAHSISMNNSALKFELTGTHDDLDRQINEMEQKIAKMPNDGG